MLQGAAAFGSGHGLHTIVGSRIARNGGHDQNGRNCN
jgi:hypothetical protein